MAGGITVFLHFGHPQPMEIAVGVYSQSFVITEAYRSAGIIAGLSDFEMPAVFGLDINPFNVRLLWNISITDTEYLCFHIAMSLWMVLCFASINYSLICTRVQ